MPGIIQIFILMFLLYIVFGFILGYKQLLTTLFVIFICSGLVIIIGFLMGIGDSFVIKLLY